MDTCTYRVSVRKTVQVKQYEPTTIELSCEGTCPRGSLSATYDQTFVEIKAKMNEIFGEKPKTDLGALG